jgi:hypothetical protein
MGGMTPNRINAKDKDLESLKELINVKFEELDKRLNLRDEATHKALTLATGIMDKRLDGMNEFREQLSTQAASFVTKEYLEQIKVSVEHRTRDLELWKSNIDGRMVMIAVGIPIFITICQIALKLVWS